MLPRRREKFSIRSNLKYRISVGILKTRVSYYTLGSFDGFMIACHLVYLRHQAAALKGFLLQTGNESVNMFQARSHYRMWFCLVASPKPSKNDQ